MTVREKQFICRRCGCAFSLCARYAYYCAACRKKVRSEQVMYCRATRKPGVARGVGSGGNQWGKKNHQFKDGLSHYKDNFYRANPEQRCCEVCGSMKNVVVHHIDKNRRNNRLDNLMLLCRGCHAQVHGLAAHLGEIPMVEENTQNRGTVVYDTAFGYMNEWDQGGA